MSFIYILRRGNSCMWCTCDSSRMVDFSCEKKCTSLIISWLELQYSVPVVQLDTYPLVIYWLFVQYFWTNYIFSLVLNGILYSNVGLLVLQTWKKKPLSINISLNPKHQGGADRPGANHASAALSEWYRRQSSHSSTDATDVRPARLKCSGAEPGEAKPWKSELTGALTKRTFWGEKYCFLVCCSHHPKCINRADEYPCW